MIKRILIPTDFSEPSVQAFHYTIELNKLLKARLYLLHVIQELTDFSELNLSPAVLPDIYATFEENAWKRLNELESIIPSDTPYESHVAHGIPFNEIIKFAQSESIDLIVVGTRGKTGLKEILFGSTAEKVIRKATCPVLAVRPTGKTFQA